MKKLILALISVAAFIFIVGSIGALDNNNITALRCLIQCAIGGCIEWLALRKINK